MNSINISRDKNKSVVAIPMFKEENVKLTKYLKESYFKRQENNLENYIFKSMLKNADSIIITNDKKLLELSKETFTQNLQTYLRKYMLNKAQPIADNINNLISRLEYEYNSNK